MSKPKFTTENISDSAGIACCFEDTFDFSSSTREELDTNDRAHNTSTKIIIYCILS